MTDAVSGWGLVGAVLAATLGALFAGADTALTALTSHRLGALVEQATGARRAALERIRVEDQQLRSRYLVGRIACTALSTISLFSALEGWLGDAAIWVALGGAVALAATLFEVATTLARKHADLAAPAAARFLRPLELVLLPFSVPLGWLGSRLATKRDGEAPPDPRVAEAEVEILVEESEKSGLFGPEPAEMIRNVLEFADLTAKDVMIPRGSVEAIEIAMPLDAVVAFVTESGHSRYPVYKDQIDNVVGILHAKDLFKAIGDRKTSGLALKDLVRAPANFVAESQPLSTLLREMRKRRQHLAIVVDEFGGLSGIVALEDLIEVIVGDIEDEHDEAEAPSAATPAAAPPATGREPIPSLGSIDAGLGPAPASGRFVNEPAEKSATTSPLRSS